MAATMADEPAAGRNRPGGAGQRTADVFVVFGITGDLAKVMTFRSLYRLERRGLLQCPIVGVAVDDWTVDRLVERARVSIEGTWEIICPTISAVSRRGCPTCRAISAMHGPEGYRDIDGVPADSTTETYAALRLDIDNWRWSGFRSSFGPARSFRSLRPSFGWSSSAHRLGFDFGSDRRPEPNQLVIELDPSTGIRLKVEAYVRTLRMRCCSRLGWSGGVRGSLAGWGRGDWRVMQPLLDAPPPVHRHASGGWGPTAADELPAGYGGWRRPWVASSSPARRQGPPSRAPPRPRRSRRSRTMPSCPAAPPVP